MEKGWGKETAHKRGLTGVVANSEGKLTLSELCRRGAECQVAGLFSASGCSEVLFLFLHYILKFSEMCKTLNHLNDSLFQTSFVL